MRWMKLAMRAYGSMCASLQIPVSPGLMRPCAVTLVASTNNQAAPPTARLPRWTRCQSSGIPSTAEYWHMGETTIRFRSVTPRIVRGLSNIGDT
jgi:hypothetical protein